ARLVADRDVVERDDRRRQRLSRRGDLDRPHFLRDHRGDRFELGQELEARLRLARLGGLGAEPIGEGGAALALGLLLLGELEVERLALAALALEGGVATAIERELSPLEMENPIDRMIEEIAVVADEDHAARITGDMLLEPQRGFEVEI